MLGVTCTSMYFHPRLKTLLSCPSQMRFLNSPTQMLCSFPRLGLSSAWQPSLVFLSWSFFLCSMQNLLCFKAWPLSSSFPWGLMFLSESWLHVPKTNDMENTVTHLFRERLVLILHQSSHEFGHTRRFQTQTLISAHGHYLVRTQTHRKWAFLFTSKITQAQHNPCQSHQSPWFGERKMGETWWCVQSSLRLDSPVSQEDMGFLVLWSHTWQGTQWRTNGLRSQRTITWFPPASS